MYEDFVRNRITELRLKKGVSEYQMSYDLGHSRGYVYNISSGKSLPPLSELFAICDYYMQDRVKKHSRHIYDIYKLLPIIPQTAEYKLLVKEVRNIRAQTNICPSAQPGVDVSGMLNFLIENNIYKEDYENITARILEESVPYDVAIEAIRSIAKSGIFDEE